MSDQNQQHPSQDLPTQGGSEQEPRRNRSRSTAGNGRTTDKLKKSLREAKKPRNRTVQQYLCDRCDGVIPLPRKNEHDGFVIHGNVYCADPDEVGGLIGDNFPKMDPDDDKFTADQVGMTVLCKKCLLKVLGIDAGRERAVDPLKELCDQEPRRIRGYRSNRRYEPGEETKYSDSYELNTGDG